MDQIKYQGYARDRGFNPIQLSTASVDAIGQQGEYVLRQMRDNADTDRRNRDQYLSGMERAQGIEAQNRAQNFDFLQNNRRIVQEGVDRNNQTKIANIGRAAQAQDETLKTLSALAGFSDTISKVVIEQRQKRDEAAELEMSNLMFETQISFDEYQALKAGEDKINTSDTRINNVVNKLKAAGYSEEYLSKIRNLSGAGLYGAMKQWAIQGGQDYGAFRAQMSDVPFEVNGQQVTLAQAAEGSPEVFNTVNTLVRSEYLKRFRGLNRAFADKYLYSGMREVETKERLLFSEKRSKELEIDRTQKETNELLTRWDSERGAGVISQIQIWAGGDPKELGEKRRKVLSYLVSAAKAGRFTGNDLVELEGTEFLLNGSSTPTTFGKQYDRELTELRDAVRSFNNQARQDREQAESDQKAQFEQDLNALAAQKPLNKAEVRKALTAWRSNGWGAPPDWLKNMETQEQLDDEAGDAILRNLKVQGTLTRKELMSNRYSDKLIERYLPFVEKQEQVSKEEQTESLNAVYAALKESLDSVGLGTNQKADYFIAQGVARREVTARASMLISRGVDPKEAWLTARDQVILQIKEGRGDGGKGIFRLRQIAGGKVDLQNRGFALASSLTNSDDDIKRFAQIRQKLERTNDATILTRKENAILKPNEIEQLQGFRNGSGSVPPIVWAISSRLPDLSPFDVADMLMNAHGQPAIQRPPAAAVYDTVRPELMRLITRKPSMDRALRAMEGSGNAYKPILDLIASKESISTDPALNGYDAMNKGGRAGGTVAIGSGTGTANFGRPLTQMSVGEVLELGAQGRIHAAGRYQFIHSTLKGLVDRGVANPNEPFNEQTQDKIAVAYLRQRTGKFWSGEASAQSYVPGLGNAWVGLRKLSPQQIVAAMEQAKANLAGSNLDVSRMRPQVVYRVSGIGPTSTGPHLDVKDVTGKFFERNSLDRYIGFKTANGVIPLSAGHTVPNGRFGAPRDYGPHLGWDYAIADGTPVVLKNGARVISKRPSAHGDVLTIATPDGRRFTFLHGKAT